MSESIHITMENTIREAISSSLEDSGIHFGENVILTNVLDGMINGNAFTALAIQKAMTAAMTAMKFDPAAFEEDVKTPQLVTVPGIGPMEWDAWCKHERCTCSGCDTDTNDCAFKFDLYNKDGDCLAMK